MGNRRTQQITQLQINFFPIWWREKKTSRRNEHSAQLLACVLGKKSIFIAFKKIKKQFFLWDTDERRENVRCMDKENTIKSLLFLLSFVSQKNCCLSGCIRVNGVIEMLLTYREGVQPWKMKHHV